MKRAIVTGGAGFVGSHVCERLVDRGLDVHVLDDLSRGSESWLPPSCTLHRGDVRDEDAVRGAFEAAQPDLVVHLAALHFIPDVDSAPEIAEAINVGGTEHVVEAARRARPAAFVFASTAAVYPNVHGPIAESIAPAPIDLYGRAKVAGEHMLEQLAAAGDTSCVGARLFNVIGPRETNPHIFPEIVEQVRRGAAELTLGNVAPQRDYVDVRDVADAIATLAFGAPGGWSTFNVGTGVGVSVSEIVETCSRVVGRPLGIRLDPTRLRPVDRLSLVADVSAIEDALGWRAQRAFQDTLAELVLG